MAISWMPLLPLLKEFLFKRRFPFIQSLQVFFQSRQSSRSCQESSVRPLLVVASLYVTLLSSSVIFVFRSWCWWLRYLWYREHESYHIFFKRFVWFLGLLALAWYLKCWKMGITLHLTMLSLIRIESSQRSDLIASMDRLGYTVPTANRRNTNGSKCLQTCTKAQEYVFRNNMVHPIKRTPNTMTITPP